MRQESSRVPRAPCLLGPAGHLVQGGAGLGGDERDVVELRLGAAVGDLHPDHHAVNGDLCQLPCHEPAFDDGDAHSHRPGDPLDLGAERIDASRVREHVQDVPGPALLHRDGAHPGVECAGVECGRDRVAELLTGDIVEIRLEHQRRLARADGGLTRPPPDHDLGAVRQVVHLAGAPSEAGRRDRHVGERPERRAQRGEQGGTRGRRELYPDVTPVGRNPLEQSHGGRGRIGQPAVRAAHGAAPGGHRRGAHLVDAQHLECGRRPHDVDDRVVPADLVEVHLVDGPPVQRGLDGGQRAEHGQRPLGHPRRQCGVLNESGDGPMGADHHVVAADDGARACDPSPHALVQPQVPAREGEPVQQGTDLVDVGPGVNERPERHVPCDTGEAVEPRHRLGARGGARHCRSRAMAHAAP